MEIGAIEKQRRNRFPGVLEYELTAAGRDLLFVVDTLERWLTRRPEAHCPWQQCGEGGDQGTGRGLVDDDAAALAAGPLSLTELDGVIGSLSYPSLERRLAAMRLAGQVEARPSNGSGTPYAVTEWLRQGVAPARRRARAGSGATCRARPPRSAASTPRPTFLLAVPLLQLPAETVRLLPDGG